MSREQMMQAVERVGIKLCSYSLASGGWATTCDCKFGFESDRSSHERFYCGEQTGCPEMRSLYVLLMDMTDEEYAAIKARGTAAFDDWRLPRDSF